MAQQYADCIVAALEIMRQHGVTLAPDGYTTNWGSSQGALTALFFAKWYDEEAPKWFKDTLRLKSTFSSEGAVLTKEFREYTYQHPEYIAIELTVMVSYFKAFSQEQLGGYKPEDFVPEWYLEKKYEHNGRKISFFDAISHYFPEITDPITKDLTSFEQVVAPDMLTADGKVDMDCPKMRAWLACLAKYNNPDGWVHAHPVYMVHSPEDVMIPYKEAYRLYLRISNGGNSKPGVSSSNIVEFHGARHPCRQQPTRRFCVFWTTNQPQKTGGTCAPMGPCYQRYGTERRRRIAYFRALAS
jgi:hypothetical protein